MFSQRFCSAASAEQFVKYVRCFSDFLNFFRVESSLKVLISLTGQRHALKEAAYYKYIRLEICVKPNRICSAIYEYDLYYFVRCSFQLNKHLESFK